MRLRSMMTLRLWARAVAAAKSSRDLSNSWIGEGRTVAQRFTAIEIGAGQACLGFGSGKRSLFLTVIELNKDLAFFDGIAGGEATFGDQAGDFIAQFKLLTGDDSADGARCGRPLRLRDADGRNGVARFGP